MVIIFLAIAVWLPGCDLEQPEQVLPDATVSIFRTEECDTTSFKVVFEPSENTVAYEYAIGKSNEEDLFLNGSLNNVLVEGNGSLETVFGDLLPDTEYTVFARAFNEADEAGPLARLDISTLTDKYEISLYFLTDNSLSVKFEYSPDYTRFRYYLGKECDKEAFLGGELEDGMLTDIFGYYYISYFDIEPGEYVFYAQGEDLSGAKTDLMEISVKTPDPDDIPCAEFQVVSQDIFRGKYILTPNVNCGKISAVVNIKGYYDATVNGVANWMGDYITPLSLWESLPFMNGCYAIGETLEFSFDDVLFTSSDIEIIALFWDNDLNPAGVKRFVVPKPEYDGSLPAANVSITVSDITASGATYTYVPDGNTLGFLYETVDADWYDEFCQSPDWNEYYMHNLLYDQGYYWSYSGDVVDGKVVYQETAAEPGKRYYAVACPMNANGPHVGWGPMSMVEFVTEIE